MEYALGPVFADRLSVEGKPSLASCLLAIKLPAGSVDKLSKAIHTAGCMLTNVRDPGDKVFVEIKKGLFEAIRTLYTRAYE